MNEFFSNEHKFETNRLIDEKAIRPKVTDSFGDPLDKSMRLLSSD